jgi:hypothetical protein
MEWGNQVIHYHGTPITPREQLLRMAGRHFCVSFARPDDLACCVQIGQSVMFDNGAFSAFTRGEPFNEKGYLAWLDPVLEHPHWAIIPDVIDGTVEQQRDMVARWPHGTFGAPVWHLGLSLDYLLELADAWPRICFGSTARYWDVGGDAWCARMDEAFNALEKRHRRLPWVHGLRMLGQVGECWPLASADSTNVAQNFKRNTGCAECNAETIDRIQCPAKWKQHATQGSLSL